MQASIGGRGRGASLDGDEVKKRIGRGVRVRAASCALEQHAHAWSKIRMGAGQWGLKSAHDTRSARIEGYVGITVWATWKACKR